MNTNRKVGVHLLLLLSFCHTAASQVNPASHVIIVTVNLQIVLPTHTFKNILLVLLVVVEIKGVGRSRSDVWWWLQRFVRGLATRGSVGVWTEQDAQLGLWFSKQKTKQKQKKKKKKGERKKTTTQKTLNKQANVALKSGL